MGQDFGTTDGDQNSIDDAATAAAAAADRDNRSAASGADAPAKRRRKRSGSGNSAGSPRASSGNSAVAAGQEETAGTPVETVLTVEPSPPPAKRGRRGKAAKAAEIQSAASGICDMVEVFATLFVGPAGQFTETERSLIVPPLGRILERNWSAVEKMSAWADPAMLIVGFGLYANRLIQSKPKAASNQTGKRQQETEAMPAVENAAEAEGAYPTPEEIARLFNNDY